MARLISFDIDGTLWFGDPPGRVNIEMVRRARELGYIIGSASDRPVPAQKALWEKAGIEVSFAINKHRLDEVKAQFEAETYQHIGDTNMDEHYARLHGFDYLDVAKDFHEPWMLLDAVDAALAAPVAGQSVEQLEVLEAAVEEASEALDQAAGA